MKKILNKNKTDWNKYVGCIGYFNAKGIFVIQPNAKAKKFLYKDIVVFMVAGKQRGILLITSQPGTVAGIPMKYVKVAK